MHRALGTYYAGRDQGQQAIRMVETERIEEEHGVLFLIVYGISGNTHRSWSLANARASWATPEDDSQVNFADRIGHRPRRPTVTRGAQGADPPHWWPTCAARSSTPATSRTGRRS